MQRQSFDTCFTPMQQGSNNECPPLLNFQLTLHTTVILLVFSLLYLRRFLRNVSVVLRIRPCQLHHYNHHRVYNTLTKCCHDIHTGRQIASIQKSDIETLLDMYMDRNSRLATHDVLVQSRQAFDT